jgi:hypothetical protein
MNDAALLATLPDFISLGAMLKASPAMESGRRIIYFEASNETLDQQNESVAAKALADSTGYYLKYGNVDLDHITMLGPKLGIPDYASFEIGKPVDVGQRRGSTFVKAEIYKGDGPAAEKANHFWSSLTDISPPARWYPSVAGAVLDKAVEFDPDTKARKAVIKKVRWSNVGCSRTPVNQNVPTVATVPIGIFAKCQLGGGLDFAKAMAAAASAGLAAGYGTDDAGLIGRGALRRQSREGGPLNYFDFRNKVAKAMREGACGKNPGAAELIAHTMKHFGTSKDEAADHVERFMRDLHEGLKQRRRR